MKLTNVGEPLLLLAAGNLQGDGHADSVRDRFRSRTLAMLLMSTPEQWPQLDSATQKQRADSPGAMKLVSAETERGHAEIVKPHRHLARCLGRIAMNRRAFKDRHK